MRGEERRSSHVNLVSGSSAFQINKKNKINSAFYPFIQTTESSKQARAKPLRHGMTVDWLPSRMSSHGRIGTPLAGSWAFSGYRH
jgi:hypothetical protein